MRSPIYVSAAFLLGGAAAQQSAYGQCGGQGWSGATACGSGYFCSKINDYYSQCIPGAPATTLATSTGSASPPGSTASGKVKYAGVNIAGFDFGCGTDGTCNTTAAYPPLAALGGNDGAGQMSHFVKDDGMNIFRLPVGWQYLVGNTLGGTLNSANFQKYDQLVQACLTTGATCIIDIHNYARWNGGIVGQGGPTDDQLASVWSQIATKYASQSKVAFGVMNEPHDVPDINRWGTTVQTVVTAIRKAGATSQMILLPGNNYTSAQLFVSNGSLAALKGITNLDGSTTNLIFDVHKYLDSDNSGTHTECVTDNVSSTFAPLASSLRAIKRQALLSETGGGNTASCEQDLCSEISYLNSNSDVYLGYVGWAAGNFASTYELDEVPTKNGNTWTDTPLVQACLKRSA
ncbi:MAG: Endoglucanase EG-II [Stictis urceolatum]|nr:Endoglucanase EG-II [Stictis urceolata]